MTGSWCMRCGAGDDGKTCPAECDVSFLCCVLIHDRMRGDVLNFYHLASRMIDDPFLRYHRRPAILGRADSFGPSRVAAL